jgi:anti-sigma regulatory factor (Ser/Thr protein kinase)
MAVAAWLGAGAEAGLRDDACLLVSELVTNSIRFADQPVGAPLVVRTTSRDGAVRVEVHDQGDGSADRRAPGAPEGGFGLHLVERLATRWGVRHDHGTRVWFELAL